MSCNIVAFASGGGSNFEAIVKAIENGQIDGKMMFLVSNNSNAGVIDRATNYGIESFVWQKKNYDSSDEYAQHMLNLLSERSIDLIALCGYMKLIPNSIIDAFPNRVLNIHPALIPSFCGQGFFGDRVHKAVLDRGVRITGVTVHLVDHIYDHGAIVAQAPVAVYQSDTPQSLAERVLKVEHKLYPKVIELFCDDAISFRDGQAFIDDDRFAELDFSNLLQ
jgi:phosphoribosylglycinamide formyltransferase-1